MTTMMMIMVVMMMMMMMISEEQTEQTAFSVGASDLFRKCMFRTGALAILTVVFLSLSRQIPE
jgi:hypothetical protein